MLSIDDIRRLLDDPRAGADWLRGLGLTEVERGHANVVNLAVVGVTLDLLADIATQLQTQLPKLSDPDRALNNLDRFISVARSPLSLAALFERDRQALPILLQIFSTSQHLSDLLITDREAYDLLRMTEG